jgi:hypothetical protein
MVNTAVIMFLTQNNGSSMEWGYITAVKSFITLASGDFKNKVFLIRLFLAKKGKIILSKSLCALMKPVL